VIPADPTEPIEPDRSLGELFDRLTTDVGELVSTQLTLARTELKEDVSNAGRAAALFGAAGVTAFLAILLLSFAAAWGLAEIMEPGWAFLIVGAVWAVVAAIVFAVGRQRARETTPVAEQTVETLKEDVRWARQQTN
jgi:uncharacterized membrane protein YqjE